MSVQNNSYQLGQACIDAYRASNEADLKAKINSFNDYINLNKGQDKQSFRNGVILKIELLAGMINAEKAEQINKYLLNEFFSGLSTEKRQQFVENPELFVKSEEEFPQLEGNKFDSVIKNIANKTLIGEKAFNIKEFRAQWSILSKGINAVTKTSLKKDTTGLKAQFEKIAKQVENYDFNIKLPKRDPLWKASLNSNYSAIEAALTRCKELFPNEPVARKEFISKIKEINQKRDEADRAPGIESVKAIEEQRRLEEVVRQEKVKAAKASYEAEMAIKIAKEKEELARKKAEVQKEKEQAELQRTNKTNAKPASAEGPIKKKLYPPKPKTEKPVAKPATTAPATTSVSASTTTSAVSSQTSPAISSDIVPTSNGTSSQVTSSDAPPVTPTQKPTETPPTNNTSSVENKGEKKTPGRFRRFCAWLFNLPVRFGAWLINLFKSSKSKTVTTQ